MNGYTNISSRINRQVEIFILIYVVGRKERSDMELMTDGAASKIESVLMNALTLSKKEVGLVTGLPALREQAGKQIQLSVKDINKLWSH